MHLITEKFLILKVGSLFYLFTDPAGYVKVDTVYYTPGRGGGRFSQYEGGRGTRQKFS